MFAKVIQSVGAKTGKLFSHEQKGFIPGKAGCLEHCCTVNMMINDAMSYNKELYIMSLDFKDAFGSVPHELLKYNLLKSGFPENLVGIITDSYEGAFSNIITSKGIGDCIPIRKGVKQGCPLSPTLFNLCLDPLIRRIDHFKDDLGYKFGQCLREEAKAVQAYADDVLLFSNTREGLQKELELVRDFVRFTGIALNPLKCKAFKYTKGRNEFVTPAELWDSSKNCRTQVP
jgi:hypothetical protein